MRTGYGDLSPRLGIAWDPQGDGRMTIRAAYGLFYDQPPHFFYYPVSNNAPYGNTIQLPTPAGGFADPWLGYPGGNPFPYCATRTRVLPEQSLRHVSTGYQAHLYQSVEPEFPTASRAGSGWLR